MKTKELLPLALLAGAAVTTHGCHLRGDNNLNAHHSNNNADLHSIGKLGKAKNDVPALLVDTTPPRGRGGLGRVAGGTRHHREPATMKLDKATRMELRATKIESPDEVLRHKQAASVLEEKCAAEMAKWGCQIGFKPARCLSGHATSDVCKEALISWYHGVLRARIDDNPDTRTKLDDEVKMHPRLERRFVRDQSMKQAVEEELLPETLAIPGDARGLHDPHGLHGPHHDRPRDVGGPEPRGSHDPRVRSPHHKHPHPRHGGDRESMDFVVRNGPPRSTFTVLMDWINGVDSSDSSDSSNSAISDSYESSSDSDDSSEDDEWPRRPHSERRNRRGDAHHSHRDHHNRIHGPPSRREPSKELHHKTEPDNIAHRSYKRHERGVVEVSMFEGDPESVILWMEEALSSGEPLHARGHENMFFEDPRQGPHGYGPHGHGPHGHGPSHHRGGSGGGGQRFHENSQHDHLRYRNRLPDDFDHSSWHDSFEGDFEDCDFVQGVLAFFFLVGAFTLVLMPFVMFARALKRMARSSRSSLTSTPPGPSSSAFGGFARRRESNAAAADAAAAGYEALPEEPTAAAAPAAAVEDDEDDDAIVVTGTPVNPPPSVNI